MNDKATLKAIMLGTEDYHTTMRQIVVDDLHRRINYVPQHMKPDNPVLSVHPKYLEQVDVIMQWLGNNRKLVHCNRRSPFLALAWLLIGSDNEYRFGRYIDIHIPKRVAMLHIRIALGDIPVDGEIAATVKAVKDARRVSRDKYWFAWTGVWAIVRAANFAAWDVDRTIGRPIAAVTKKALTVMDDVANQAGIDKRVVRTAIVTKARQWAHISDEEALQIARQLTFDILSM